MRSGFGRKALELRVEQGMSQTDFAKETGWSLSRISNIEYQRASISDDVLRIYLRVLKPTGAQTLELRKLANYSNSVKNHEQKNNPHPPLVALFEQFGEKLSPSAVAKIQEIIERESGEKVSSLQFSNSGSTKGNTKARKASKRPSLNIMRFVQICIMASRFRRRFVEETTKLSIEKMLDQLAYEDERFDYRITEMLPSFVDGAFACIVGENTGNLLIVEEDRFKESLRGVYFQRHVIAHEVAHHILHDRELCSDGELLFAPQALARNSGTTIGSKNPIHQVVDTIVEVEAECFATFMLLPWEAFMKGTELRYLAQDFGEQLDELKRYHPYFKQNAVVNEFKKQLWEMGEKAHPIFRH